MLFASLDFLLFFVPVLAVYWWLWSKPKLRELWVLGASYFFYMASSRPPDGGLPTPWYFVLLLVFSTVLDYWCSHGIARLSLALSLPDPDQVRAAKRARNQLLIISLVGNLGLLAYFKYTNFLLSAFTDIANTLGAGWVAPHLEVMLPIGISFYTFQSLSYTIDVWRQKLTPEPSFRKFALFVVFFPQLVAGPIVRASEFLPQLHRQPQLAQGRLEWGLFRIWKGVVKKVILGDFIAVSLSDIIFSAPQDYTSAENLIALYGFTLQIYADFSGYSDIAIGVAALLGFVIPENFDRPYQASHLGEFWRRWHMTLSTWLRDYLFFPLGGSRGSPMRTYFNLWLTMFLVGMWHAASWNFVIYSNLHGLAMVFNRWNRRRQGPLMADGGWKKVLGWGATWMILAFGVGRLFLKLESEAAVNLALLFGGVFALVVAVPRGQNGGIRILQVALTFHFTVLSRVFFRAADLDSAAIMVTKLVRWDGLGVRPGLFRAQGLGHLLESILGTTGPLAQFGSKLADVTLLVVLAAGLGYHLTPRRWIDESLFAWFKRRSGWQIGVIFALTALLVLKLLDGPRANIYFVF